MAAGSVRPGSFAGLVSFGPHATAMTIASAAAPRLEFADDTGAADDEDRTRRPRLVFAARREREDDARARADDRSTARDVRRRRERPRLIARAVDLRRLNADLRDLRIEIALR